MNIRSCKLKMIRWNTYKLVVLALQIFLSCGDNFAVLYMENLALNKMTAQSSGNTSHLAINGDYGDFAEIPSGDLKWWRVDLGKPTTVEVIKVHNQKPCCESMLVNLSIFTSTYHPPGTPNSANSKWTRKFYRMRPAKHFMVKVFYPVIETRNVAITSSYNQPLRISEVEISGGPATSNVAIGKSGSHILRDLTIHDGMLTMANNGMYDDCSNVEIYTWAVDLRRLYTTWFIRISRGAADCYENDSPLATVNINSDDIENPSHYNWVQYGALWNLSSPITSFTNGLVLRHLLVQASESEKLSLGEVEVYVHVNLAFRKPTQQSDIYIDTLKPEFAVNGYLGDFTHTRHTGDRRWSVDLLSVYTVEYIEVNNRENHTERLAMVSLYTSKVKDDWLLRSYTEGAYGLVKTIYLQPSREVRHIAISTNKTDSPLSLAEVVVKEFNVAKFCETSQRRENPRSASRRAVDGSYNTHYSGYTYAREGVEPYWKVKLRKTIVMTSVAIFFYKELCEQYPHSKLISCLLTGGLIQIKTSKMAAPQPVTLAEHAHWSLCHVQETTPFERIHLECNRNQRYPFTRHLSIQPHTIGQRLTLREVEIYGKQLPELAHPVTVTIKSVSYTFVEISFPIWNMTNVGAFPPTSYYIALGSSSSTQQALHKDHINLGKISIRWNNLHPDTTYISIITCQYKGTACLGSATFTNITTLDCEAPEQPRFSWSFEGEGINRSLKVVIDEVEPHCVSVIEYRVILTAETNITIYNQSTESAHEHLIHSIASDITHNLSVKVTNNDKISRSKSEEIPPEAEVPDKPTLSSHNFTSNCVHIDVLIPSEHVFQLFKFIFICRGGSQTQESISDEPVSFRANRSLCGFPDNTMVTCEIQAENSVGKGPKLIVNGSTPKHVESTTTTQQRVTKPTTAKTSTGSMNITKRNEASTSQQSSTKPTTAKNTTGVSSLLISLTAVMVSLAAVLAIVVFVVIRKRRAKRNKVAGLDGQEANKRNELINNSNN